MLNCGILGNPWTEKVIFRGDLKKFLRSMSESPSWGNVRWGQPEKTQLPSKRTLKANTLYKYIVVLAELCQKLSSQKIEGNF